MKLDGEYIVKTLIDNGYEAFFVGGCVRDAFLGMAPKDIDIATNALPEIVEGLFERTIPTGKDYGTITILINEHSFEVTTYRLDCDYDGRRPKVVTFANTLIEDLSRRDFTMNAMAMGLDGEIVDPFEGRKDLENGLLNFVGNPMERIREDRIRILRYVRFLSRYDLQPGPSGVAADEIVDISNLSAERVREEFNKIMMSSSAPRGIQLLEEMGLLKQFFPELSMCKGFKQDHPAHFQDVFDHTLTVLSKCKADLILRLAALCHDLGKVSTKTFDEAGIGHFYGHQKESVVLTEAMMKRLKYSNKEIEAVKTLVHHHMRTYEAGTTASARRIIYQVGMEFLDLFFELQLADTTACSGDRDTFVAQINHMKMMCHQLIEMNEAFSLKDLKINGNDLMAIGYTGKAIGETLNALLECVISEICVNEADVLLEKAKELFSNSHHVT